MRKIFCNDLRRVGDCGEPFLRVTPHETKNFVDAGHVHARSDATSTSAENM
jgi:hypothetical protein